jgi:LuxR family transcriptional regulator, maltose regulon positive regulatory protein
LPGLVSEHGGAPPQVTEELVATKLLPASVRAGSVTRQRLMDALSVGNERRLTLVDAPTGYGKTMLVAAWCAQRADAGARTVSWLSLSPADNDPMLFARYLIGALQGVGSVRELPEPMLDAPEATPTAWMRSLVNELADASEEITLVLDDYHVVTEPACHALVQFLLDRGPSSLHLIICTRTEPPLGLGTLRVAGELAELRTADLRFTLDEAAALLVQVEGLPLDEEAVASLAERTEGWAAGLYLAALWLRGRAGTEADLERFAGDNRHVVDYLSELVLDQLDDEVREFLLMTSIADRVSTPLCEAITTTPVAGMLEQIERSNLFLVPLDDTRTWYRYHHLFGEMLRSELARRHPDLLPALHRRASRWYREHGLISEAIEQATSAGDYHDAAQMISEQWLAIGRWGGEATLRRWLDAFGPDELQNHPQLALICAFLTGVSGGTEIEFWRWLELAEQGLADDHSTITGTASLRGGVQMLRSAFGYRNIRTATAEALRTARLEAETDGVFRVVALANLAFLLYLSGDPARARLALSEAIRDPLAQRRPYGYLFALSTSALISLDEGDGDRGERTAAQALSYAEAAGLSENQVAGLLHVAIGRALSAAGRLGSARTRLEHGLTLLRGGVMPARYIYALLYAAPAVQAAGDLSGALALLEEAETLLAGFQDAGILLPLLHDVERRISLARRRRHEPDATALTGAELAVLRALRSPKSQRAIAQDLSISINTIKTHTAAIYRKLAVTSRDDAIARATELGL